MQRIWRFGAGLAAISPFHDVSHATGPGTATWFAGIAPHDPPRRRAGTGIVTGNAGPVPDRPCFVERDGVNPEPSRADID